jgi:hypothetical protein
MRIARRGALVAAAMVALAAGGAATAATPAQNKAFAKELRADLKPTFAKKAPALVLGTVTCTLAKSGKTARCHAHFTDPKAKADVVYAVTAQRSGSVIKWSAGSPVCSEESTHTPINCG